MKCPACGEKNDDMALFCRCCLENVEARSDSSGYNSENFHRLREETLKLIEEEITLKEYFKFIYNYRDVFTRSADEIAILKVSFEIKEDVKQQLSLTEEGTRLYLEAVDGILNIIEEDENFLDNDDNMDVIIDCLEIAEEANEKLNKAIQLIGQQSDGDSLFFDSDYYDV